MDAGHNPRLLDHPNPLKIAVLGGGIEGLSAAIALSRGGHQVDLFEQPEDGQEPYSVADLTPNITGLLRRWGVAVGDIGAVEVTKLVQRFSNGEENVIVDLAGPLEMWQHPWQLVQASRLRQKLRDVVASNSSDAHPLTLHKSATLQVASADPETGRVLLADGTAIEADVVVAADGIHSTAREAIGERNTTPFDTGKVEVRFIVSREALLRDPVSSPLAEQLGTVLQWHGDNIDICMRPCNNNEVLSFVLVLPGSETLSNEQDSNALTSELLGRCENFEPALNRAITKATSTELRVSKQLDMNKLPTWTRGRLALVGDAVHPFPAHSSNGLGQAIEDAAALAAVLPAGTAPSDVARHLGLYQEIRAERAYRLQDFARQAGKTSLKRSNTAEATENVNFNFGHDETDSSTIKFKKWLWAQKPGVYWRMPIAFGPSPGPRLDSFGRPRGGHRERKVETATIMFTTSRTYLESLLPTNSFRFRSPGTIGFASIIITTLDNMSWLGGGGYTHCGLYVHDVEYVKTDGTTVYGTYLPVLFENLTDPIISGRDELGWNKVFCDIGIARSAESHKTRLSWRGAEFLNVAMDHLESRPPKIEGIPADAAKDYGVLTYKYVPATGEPGKADVQYPCVTPHAEEARIAQAIVHSVRWCHNPKVEFEAGDWESLPTLHHISSSLAAVPIYRFIFAKVTEGLGVSDMTSCRRIE